MIYRFLFVVLIVFAAGCVQPVETLTPSPAAPSLSPSPINTLVPTVAPSDTPTATPSSTDTPTATETPSPTSSPTSSNTPTLTATSTPSATATASRTPRFTPGPTPTADVIEFSYPVTITLIPFAVEQAPPIIRCLLLNYDFAFEPGKIIITRRDKAAYFACLDKES